MTPFDIVLEHFRFPSYIVPHPIQVDVINDLAPLNAGGYWLDMGTGKTFCSTVVALYHRILYGHSIVVIMPPLLVKQWSTWLGSIQPALSITEYNGTPKQRVAKSLDSDFVLVGSQIFKKDYARIDAHFQSKRYTVIIDEAAMVSNNQSDTHKKIYWFCVLQSKLLLTGTPANNPLDLYGLLTFTEPGTYKHKIDFERRHVKYWTSYGKPTEYIDLSVLMSKQLAATRSTNAA